MAKIVFLFNNKKLGQFLQEKKDCFALTYAANGQSNKQPTIINYDSRIVMTINLPSLRLYESRITIVDCLLDLPLAFLLNGVPYGLLLLPPCSFVLLLLDQIGYPYCSCPEKYCL